MEKSGSRMIAHPAVILVAILGFTLVGCAEQDKTPNNSQPRQVDPQQVQSSIMAFANRYIAAMADAYDRLAEVSTSPDAKLAAIRGKLMAASGAIGNAAELNPVVGLMDMAVMVR